VLVTTLIEANMLTTTLFRHLVVLMQAVRTIKCAFRLEYGNDTAHALYDADLRSEKYFSHSGCAWKG